MAAFGTLSVAAPIALPVGASALTSTRVSRVRASCIYVVAKDALRRINRSQLICILFGNLGGVRIGVS